MLIKTQNTDLGYLLLDHRNSPELPIGITAAFFETSTYTCSHCERVVIMNPDRKRDRVTCKGCNHMICDNCASTLKTTGKCLTFKQIVDEYLEKIEKGIDSKIILT